MPIDMSTITGFLKLPKKVVAIICLISGILLFSTEDFLRRLSLFDFKENYSVWIGVIFLFSLAISVVNVVEYFFRRIKKSRRKHARNQAIVQKIKVLDDYEMAVVREFLIQKKNTLEMSIDDSTVMSLIKDGIIEQVADQGYSTVFTGRIFYFRLHDKVQEALSELDFERIQSVQRPRWVDQLETKAAFDKNTSELIKGMRC